MKEHKRIYLDYAAATPLDADVLAAMEPYFARSFANANATHTEAREAKRALEDARNALATYIHATPREIIFTSGGTESNSLAIFGVLNARGDLSGTHLIATAIEHPSVRDVFHALERRGATVSYIPVTKEGIVDLKEFEHALRPETRLVSVMYANNEIGTIQPIKDIGRIIKKYRGESLYPLFHTDASQIPLFIPLDVRSVGVDLLSLDAQKLYGPKGVGALFRKEGVALEPLFVGGRQEGGLRPGTENVPGIVGFQKAFELAEARREKDNAYLKGLQTYFFECLASRFPVRVVNGSTTERLPNNINVSFKGVSSEFLVLALDERGVACSTRSACLAGGGEGSYVIAELDRSRANSSVRFTLGRKTSKEDIDDALDALEDALKHV